MSPEEKTKALAELDQRYQKMNSPEYIRTLSYHASGILTNE